MWGCSGAVALLLLLGCAGESRAVDLNGRIGGPRVLNGSSSDLDYRARSEADHPFYMEWFYAFTNAFIDLLLSKDVLPEGMLALENRQLKSDGVAGKVLGHYWLLLALLVILLLTAVLIPCVGCCLCCCSSSGSSRWRDEYDEKGNLRSRRNVASGVLALLFVLLAFGFTFALLSNQAVNRGTNELPDYLNDTIHDLGLYIYSVTDDIEVLLKTNFNELSVELVLTMETCGQNVLAELKKFEGMVAFEELDNLVSGLQHVKEDLSFIDSSSKDLRTNATQLDAEFSRIKGKLVKSLTECGTPCNDIRKEVEAKEISAAEEFEKLPVDQVATALQKVTALLDGNIVAEVRKGREAFLSIGVEVQNAVNSSLPDAIAKIEEINDELNEVFDDASRKLNETFLVLLQDEAEPDIREVRYYIAEYSVYWYYFGLLVSCILIVVSVLVFLGVVCGLCNKRPGDYDKSCGPCFLTTALWMIFSTTSILMILNVVQMIGGIMSERVVCETLKNPNDNRIIGLANDWMDFKNFSFGSVHPPQLTIGGILDACHRNEPLVKVLKIEEVVDFDKWKNYTDSYKVNDTIQEFVKKIGLRNNYEFLNEDAKKKLNELSDSGLDDVDFNGYANILKENITDVNLIEYADDLRNFASQLPENLKNLKNDLLTSANDIEACQEKYIVPMTNSCHELGDTLLELEKEIKFNKTSMKYAIQVLIKKAEEAETWINTIAPKTIKLLAEDLGGSLYTKIYDFVVHVTTGIGNDVGRCGPLSNLFKATIVAGCDKVLDPFNAFWFAVLWCLILFIPVIILTLKLIALQRQSNSDSGFIYGK